MASENVTTYTPYTYSSTIGAPVASSPGVVAACSPVVPEPSVPTYPSSGAGAGRRIITHCFLKFVNFGQWLIILPSLALLLIAYEHIVWIISLEDLFSILP